MRWLYFSVTLIISLYFISNSQLTFALIVDESSIASTSISFPNKPPRTIHCYQSIAGDIRVQQLGIDFTSFAQLARKHRSKNPRKAVSYRRLIIPGNSACQSLPPITETPSSEVTPAAPSSTPGPPSGQPTIPPPAATPTPASANFDRFGNVTALGKATFQMPLDLECNISRGKQVFESYCTGCHQERSNRSYPDIDANIRRSPMLYDDAQIAMQQRCDLVAWLNRFRL